MSDLVDDPLGTLLGTAPGLPDGAFEHDGLVTKRVVRAAALAELRPRPGLLLWDLGTGAGSVAVEWARSCGGADLAGPTAHRPRAIGVERDPVRAARARRNAARLAPPGSVEIREGDVAAVVPQLPPPGAVFIGGGATAELIERCLTGLEAGGVLVVHGVTLETEEVVVQAHLRHGGSLCRISVETVEPLGGLHGWTPSRTVVQWSVLVDGATRA